MTYNGWANYETWNIVLWVDNEIGSYRARCEQKEPWTAELAEEFCREQYPDGTPDMDGPDDMDEVLWDMVAEHWLLEQEEEAINASV
jgi:hypothetical protein